MTYPCRDIHDASRCCSHSRAPSTSGAPTGEAALAATARRNPREAFGPADSSHASMVSFSAAIATGQASISLLARCGTRETPAARPRFHICGEQRRGATGNCGHTVHEPRRATSAFLSRPAGGACDLRAAHLAAEHLRPRGQGLGHPQVHGGEPPQGPRVGRDRDPHHPQRRLGARAPGDRRRDRRAGSRRSSESK
jgi:hypothetical protein